MYSASSSLRACTLRLPSETLSRLLSSLKLARSTPASADTIPRRTRSWIRRSSSAAARAAPRAEAAAPLVAAGCRIAFDLATVPPRDPQSEDDMQAAETRGEQPVRRTGGEQRRPSERQEPDAHHRYHRHREGAARHDPGAVQ